MDFMIYICDICHQPTSIVTYKALVDPETKEERLVKESICCGGSCTVQRSGDPYMNVDEIY